MSTKMAILTAKNRNKYSLKATYDDNFYLSGEEYFII